MSDAPQGNSAALEEREAFAQASALSNALGLPVFVHEFATGLFFLSFRPFADGKKPVVAQLSADGNGANVLGLHPDDPPKLATFLSRLKKSDALLSIALRVADGKGGFRACKFSAKSFFCNGAIEKAVGFVEPIAEEKTEPPVLAPLDTRDSLTGFLDHSGIQRAIINELKTRVEVRRDALVLIEFDNLTEINEKLCRVFGDEILILAAEKIEEACAGKTCLFGRFSGDEFLLFFKDIRNDAELQNILSKIIGMIKGLYAGDVNMPDLAASAGVVITSGATDMRTLMERAQKAIYIQKIGKVEGFLLYSPEMEGEMGERGSGILQARGARDEPPADSKTADMLLDILSSTKDLDSAVNLSLLKIGRRHGIDFECVIEFAERHGAIEARKTYEWGAESGCTPNVQVPLEDFARLRRSGDKIASGDAAKVLGPLAQLLPESSLGTVAAAKIYNNGEFSGFLVFARSKFKPNWAQDELSVLRTFSKILSSYIAKARAFSRAEAMIKKISQTDSITGLYNYRSFCLAAEDAIKACGDEDADFAIIAFDVRGFKQLNEFYGYKEGDAFLKAIADFISPNEYFATGCRMHSDIFLALIKLPKGETDESVNGMLQRNMKLFLERQSRRYPRCNLHIVCGTCRVAPPKITVQKAIDNANTLRKNQKSEFRTSSKIYSGDVASEIDFRSRLTSSLPAALAGREFLFYLQPKVSIKTGKIVGAEALVRWERDGKLLQPGLFLPVFESNGLITMIDFYVYESVCRYLRDRIAVRAPVVPISLNVSGVHLQSKSFAQNLLALIKKYCVPPSLLEFELTETVLLENMEAALQVFSTLQNEGFKISIDDFGSGHSSLLLLKKFPFNVVKMDKGFLPQNDEISGKDKIVLSSAIDMAAKLDIKVLCEGVEKKEHLDFLGTTACDIIQGFYFSKPLPVLEFDRLLEEGRGYEI